MCIIYPQHFIIITSSCMIYNHIILHDMDTVEFLFQLFVRFWERHRLNLICVWEFPEYLWLSLLSGLHCVMSYLIQADKQYACTDSNKEWDMHMGGHYMHSHTQISTFGRLYHSVHIILLHCLLKNHPLIHTCFATLFCMMHTENPSTSICFQPKPH